MIDLRGALGVRVRQRREGLNLSQEALAERAGLHWTYISGIERGTRNPSLNIMGSIAAALEWSFVELVTGLGAPAPRAADRKRVTKEVRKTRK